MTKKILFQGDSITDCGRSREDVAGFNSFGVSPGYPGMVAADLWSKYPQEYEVVNRGISGNRIVDLYSRIKVDCWNHKPDFLSILIGVNDVWHEVEFKNGVELDRFERMYRMLIEDTKKVLPNVKMMLCEPFVLEGLATSAKFDQFLEVYKYAELVKKLAAEYGLYYLPLQETISKAAASATVEEYLTDGVHPAEAGAKLIANEWLKKFDEINK